MFIIGLLALVWVAIFLSLCDFSKADEKQQQNSKVANKTDWGKPIKGLIWEYRLTLIVVVMLMLAAYSSLDRGLRHDLSDFGFYNILKLTVCGMFGYMLLQLHRMKSDFHWSIVASILNILIYFPKDVRVDPDIWLYYNIFAIVSLVWVNHTVIKLKNGKVLHKMYG